MTQRIPVEAVARALKGWNSQEIPGWPYIEQHDSMRSALEASGAVFLIDEEREAVLEGLEWVLVRGAPAHIKSALSVRAKLTEERRLNRKSKGDS